MPDELKPPIAVDKHARHCFGGSFPQENVGKVT